MFGDLGLVTGVDDPVLRDTDHVRHPWIAEIDADELRRSQARVDLQKPGRGDGLAVDAGARIVVVQKELPRIVSAAVDQSLSQRSMPSSSTPKATNGFALGWMPFHPALRASMILPSLDPVKSSRVHRRLAAFGRHDDRGAVEKPTLREGEHHLSKRLVDKVERVAQDRFGSGARHGPKCNHAKQTQRVRESDQQVFAVGFRNRLPNHDS
jgi:hypothetical protein